LWLFAFSRSIHCIAADNTNLANEESDMSRYIDGFVIPLAKDRIDDYRRTAEMASRIWKEHGALEYWECVGDDLATEGMRSFTQLANAGPDETVIFAWVVFESREHRDQANQKIMADPRMQEFMSTHTPLFDFQRMAYGGFNQLVHA
jgi:uncharacterized protein YbaA (DUF1428 family)